MAIFNAHGVKGIEADIEALASHVQILGLCETWLRPKDLTAAQQFDESISVPQTHGGWRGQGGVAIKVAPLINYSVVLKHSQTEYQFITIKVAGTYITMLYVKPNSPKPVFLQCMNTIQKCTRGRSIIMGDLNARHPRWDRCANPHGRWLVEWTFSHHWTVHAPPEPTFAAHQGTSTVDIFLTKGITTDGARILSGSWDGSSDHRAVCTNVGSSPLYKLGIPRIPQSQRRNPTYLQTADAIYSGELPKLESLVNSCTNLEELEAVYSQFKDLTLKPWEPARKHRPRRYKYFWDRRLDYLKQMRSKKYRQATQDKSPESWTQYQALDRQIRLILRKNKRRCRNHVLEALCSPDTRDGSKVVKSVLRQQAPPSNSSQAHVEMKQFI